MWPFQAMRAAPMAAKDAGLGALVLAQRLAAKSPVKTATATAGTNRAGLSLVSHRMGENIAIEIATQPKGFQIRCTLLIPSARRP